MEDGGGEAALACGSSDRLLVNTSSSGMHGMQGMKDYPELEDKFKVAFPSCRHILVAVCSLGFFNVYALRVNLSVAMVAMVNSSFADNESTSNECPGQENTTYDNTETGEFNWDSNLQGIILGSFFYGYIFTQIPGGMLAEKFGGKLLFGFGVFCTAALTLLTPTAARLSPGLLIAVRVLEGVGEGVTFPAMHALLAKWVPPLERSKLGTFAYSGTQMGTVISMATSGIIADHLGWIWIFYIFGTVACVWFVVFMFVVYDSPALHPRVTTAERMLIENSTGHANDGIRPTLPWKSVFTSLPFWAILVGHTAHNWGYYTLLTSLPTFMKQVLHFNISQNGLLSALPYLVLYITMISTGQLADFLRKNHILSTTSVRKLCMSIGMGVPAVALYIIGYVGCSPMLAVGMIVLATGADGISQSGYSVNHLDIAPSYAGTLMGLTNAVATIPGFLGPQVVGLIINNQPTQARWRKVFMISATINVIGAVFYAIFASGEEQPWSRSDYSLPRIDVSEKANLLHDSTDSSEAE